MPQGNPTRDSIDGWRAAGVPGTVRGFELAQSKYGRRKWAEVIAPAIKLARRGFPVPTTMVKSLEAESSRLEKDPESRRIFLKDGQNFKEGDRLTQPELAKTLARIARNGPREFYEGETGQRLASEMAAHGGLVTLDDLRNYRAVERTPLTGSYQSRKYGELGILTAPPPSSGGIGLLQMLGMLEGSGYDSSGPGSAASIHYVAEVMRRFFADRSQYLGDPDFVKSPVKLLARSRIHKDTACDHRPASARRPAPTSTPVCRKARVARLRTIRSSTPKATPSPSRSR